MWLLNRKLTSAYYKEHGTSTPSSNPLTSQTLSGSRLVGAFPQTTGGRA